MQKKVIQRIYKKVLLCLLLILLFSCQSAPSQQGISENHTDFLEGLVQFSPELSKNMALAVSEIRNSGTISESLLAKLSPEEISLPIALYEFKIIHLYALYGNDMDVLQALIELDYDPFVPEFLFGATPLHFMAQSGKNPEMLQALLDADHPQDVTDFMGSSPLHWASQYNENAEMINVLLSNGFNPNIPDDESYEPIHLAVMYNSNPMNIVPVLLTARADPEATDANGNTVLHLFAEFNRSDVALLDLLVEAGSPINAKNRGLSDTPLHIAAEYSNAQIIKRLLAHGANPTLKNKNGYLPLHKGAWRNTDTEATALLFSLYNNLDVTEPLFSMSPLHLAAWNNANPDILKELAAGGANVNAKDSVGDTPLHIALLQNTNPIGTARTLLELDADPMIANNQNITPRQIIQDDPKFLSILEALPKYITMDR